MAIKITSAQDAILTENLIMVIFGQPGAGKSSLAFSADKPLMLDFDLGAHRTIGRKHSVQIKTWADVAALDANDLKDFNTIVVDTAGRALEVLSVDLIGQDPKLARRTGELTLQAYGALGNAFKVWLNKIRSFKKDIILICHDKDEKNGDEIFVRPEAMGNSRTELTKIADMMGYVYMQDKARTIDFNPSSSHLGKNCAGIDAQAIPHLRDHPHFMADLIQNIKTTMNAKSEEQLKVQAEFDALLESIKSANSASCCTDLSVKPLVKRYVALAQALMARSKELELVYDKEAKKFIKIEIDPVAEEEAQDFFENVQK